MNEKKNKKKAVGVKWSKLQREGEGRGWGGGSRRILAVSVQDYPTPLPPLPTECQFSTLPTLYSASDHPSPLHHPLEAL